MEFILGILVIFLLFKSGALASFGGQQVLASGQPAPASQVPPALSVPTSVPAQTVATIAQNANTATSAVNAATSALKSVSSLAKAVPIVGAVLDSLISVFAAASEKRAKQATNENTAVANAYPGWDQAVLQIQNAYNAGQISAAQVSSLLDIIWQNYWNEVGPQVQPGRNGCNSGQMSKAQADSQYPGMNQCSGSWGAGCCVAYADLANGANSILAAIKQTESSGSPAVATIPAVFASKYGGANRAQYTLTFIRPSTRFTL